MQLPPHIAHAYSLVGAGRSGEALMLLGRMAEEGDGPALYQLAEWRREGRLLPGDFTQARELYRRAGEAGIVEATRRYIALLAVGVGGPRDWKESLRLLAGLARLDPSAKRQLSLVRAMKLSAEGDPLRLPQGETLSEDPRLVRFRRVFSEAECNYLAGAAEPLFEAALTIDERTGQRILNPVRTSDTAVFPWVGENPAIHALNRRLAALSGTEHMQGEPLQVLRYAPGQQYKPHIDAIPGLANQRIMTVLVWLNEGYEGGETRFTELGIAVRGRRGDALLFGNVDADGQPDRRAVHAGLPVTKGAKLLASRWIRARPVSP
jgi:prolyl 4-hydroxylase